MPLTRISMRRGKPPAYREAVVRAVYDAMRDEFEVPEDDLFVTISQHDADEFFFGRSFLGIERDDDLVMIQITANHTRTASRKQKFYARLVEGLERSPGVDRRNVFINLVETLKENWSFGDGVAQYA